MDKPVVSILIPAYNSAAFLPKCLDSVLGQTYQNLQVVIVDDGSKDNTLEVCHKYAEKDSRIEVYHQENQGVAATRNHLLEKIKGVYFLFVDSDDWLEGDMIEFLYDCLSKNGTDIATCGNVVNDVKPAVEYQEYIYSNKEAIKEFLYHITFRGMLWNKLISSHLIGDCKFDSDISYGEDALFVWNLLQYANGVTFTTRELYHYRLNDAGISLGAFGDKKMTGCLVWKQIRQNVKNTFPEFQSIANARACVEAVILLRSAARSNYENKHNIEILQSIVKQNYPFLSQVKMASTSVKLYAYIACRSFWLSSQIEKILR